MIWSTNEIQYEGFPLLLRKPDHSNPWQYKNNLIKLVSVEHILENVTSTGLPESTYNRELSEFDHHMCTLISNASDGMIFLIETYCGKRNYYYYIRPQFDIVSLIQEAKVKFNVTLEFWLRDDQGWGFIEQYPVRIFSK